MRRMLFSLVALVFLITACEKRYGMLSEEEFERLKQVASRCFAGEEVSEEKGEGIWMIFNSTEEMVFISYSGDNYPMVMFGFNSLNNRNKCLKSIFGDRWKDVSSAFFMRAVVFAEVAGLPAECLPPERGNGFYCNVKYSAFWNKELTEIRKGICAEFYRYLVTNGFKTINCFEVY